jgi:hypothetical protein
MEQGLLIPNLSLSVELINDALDQRDEVLFSDQWMDVHGRLEARKQVTELAEPVEARVTRLRELAYLQAYHRWKSADLAAQVSDDFGLIGEALATGYSHPWLNALFFEYWMGRFPHTGLTERPGELHDIITEG